MRSGTIKHVQGKLSLAYTMVADGPGMRECIAEGYAYNSAIDYAGGKGILDIFVNES